MNIKTIKTKVFKEKDSLSEFIFSHIPKLKEESVLVVTSKIVALAQGRVVHDYNPEDKDNIIKSESDKYIKTKWCYLTLKDGHWCPNAGVDESNADGTLILWPKNSYQVAEQLRKQLRKHYGVKKVGVLITDSRIFPLRAGVTGVALGYAGFSGLRNYIGTPDIFGRKLKMTQSNIADGLATSAVLAMGEGNERMPLAVAENAPVHFVNKIKKQELKINPQEDLYVPLFRQIDYPDSDSLKGSLLLDYTPQEPVMSKGTFATQLFKRLARRAGVRVVSEPWGYAGRITFPDGTHRYFRATSFDLNTMGASEIAKDKDFANFFLKKAGYPVITGRAFFSPTWAQKIKSSRNPEAAYQYAQKLGFPVFVKPNSLSQGVDVVKVHNRSELMAAVAKICKRDRVFLVQRVAEGKDYRIVVLNGKIISAYERRALCVVGDGRATIKQLLDRKQRFFRKTGRDTVIDQNDPRMKGRLRRIGLSLQSVPAKGEEVALLDNRNLSTGGDPVDVTETMHASFRKLCIKLTKDMGLRFCGVDLMVDGDISKPVKKYKVIEINSAPGIDNYAASGKRQKQIVDELYLEVIKGMRR